MINYITSSGADSAGGEDSSVAGASSDGPEVSAGAATGSADGSAAWATSGAAAGVEFLAAGAAAGAGAGASAFLASAFGLSLIHI